MTVSVGMCGGSGAVWPMWGRVHHESLFPNNNCWSESELEQFTAKDVHTWATGAPTTAGPWVDFNAALAANPSTDTIWFVPQFLRLDGGIGCLQPRDRDALIVVSDKIRDEAGVGVDIVMSAPAPFIPITTCPIYTHAQQEKSLAAVEWCLSNASAVHVGKNYADTRGPVLDPITPNTNNGSGDPCHDGAGQGARGLVSTNPEKVYLFFGESP